MRRTVQALFLLGLLLTTATGAHAQMRPYLSCPTTLIFDSVRIGSSKTLPLTVRIVWAQSASVYFSIDSRSSFSVVDPESPIVFKDSLMIHFKFTPYKEGGDLLPMTINCEGNCTGAMFNAYGVGVLAGPDTSTASVGDAAGGDAAGAAVTLGSGYPNPSRATLTIPLTLAGTTHVLIAIVDATGRILRTVREGTMEAGSHIILADASDLPSGSYRYVLATPEGTTSRPFEIVR